MDFFTAQENARRTTTWLVILFVLAVGTLIFLTDTLIIFLLYFNGASAGQGFWPYFVSTDINTHLSIMFVILLVVILGTLYKYTQLRAGGYVVAEMLGGKAVAQDTEDPLLRRYVNVVEEMAIASGVPAPRLYVMPYEHGINAFAAGTTTDDAVISVTQACLETLNREQLQGVIAHEFSHILNGDMRLNINITGILHGILLLGLIGLRLLRIISYRRTGTSSKGGGVAGLALLGGGLAVIGFGGTFFGNLIKATVNRQREYLADASAVQFTRNPNGIAGALKSIGGYADGSRLLSPAAPEVSHFFIATGVSHFFSSLFSTHPPLQKRIKRIDPAWDGSFPKILPAWHDKLKTEEIADSGKKEVRSKVAVAAATVGALDQLAHFKGVDEQNISAAHDLLEAIPNALKTAARNPYHARALIYALLLNEAKEIKHKQMETIGQQAEKGVPENLSSLHIILSAQPDDILLPLIEMAIPTLRSLSPAQIRRFNTVMTALIRSDNHISLFEWTISTIIKNALSTELNTSFKPALRLRGLHQLQIQSRVILSMLAYVNADTDAAARHAYNQGAERLNLGSDDIYGQSQLQFFIVDNALKQLDRLVPMEKKSFLLACVAVARANKNIHIKEIEVIRAIAAAVHCPMPLVVPSS